MHPTELQPVIALVSCVLAVVLPYLLRSPRTRPTRALHLVLRAPAILAAGAGVTFGMRMGTAFGVQGAFLGVTAAYAARWAGAELLGITVSKRHATVLERAQRNQACFGMAAGLVAFGSMRLVLPRGQSLFGNAPETAAITLGAILFMAVWLGDTWAFHRLLAWSRDAKPAAEPGDIHAAQTIHLGHGEERWVVAERPGSPYRDGRSGDIVIVGNLLEVIRRLAASLFGRALAVVIALVALFVSLSPRAPAPVSVRMIDPPAKVDTPKPARAEPKDTRTWLSWYPQPGPIIDDLDRDGTEDVVGLRWDGGHEEAALSVTATSGDTFKNLWRSEPIPSQWYSRATALVRSGESLFLTDSEGVCRIFDIRTGALRASVSTPPPEQLCGAPDGPDRAFLVSEPVWKEEGLLIDATGHLEKGKRPSWCRPRWEQAKCPRADGEPCTPAKRPPFLDEVAHQAESLEEGDVGLATAHRKFPQQDAPQSADTLFAYDPTTRAKRWEAPILMSDEPLHQNPKVSHTQRAGRFFAYYQLRSGKWILGARDGRSGEVLWSQSPPRTEHGTHFSAMRATKSRLYLALDSRLEVFEAATGKPIGCVW